MDRRICFVGDSFVTGAGDPHRLGWIGRASANITGLTAYNLGVRGETSSNIADRWLREVAVRLAGVEDGRVVFSFGVNDTSQVNGRDRVDPSATVANTGIILQRSKWPMLFVGPPAVADAAHNDRTERLSVALAALCSHHRVPYLDTCGTLRNNPLWMDEVAATDGAHPGEAGYALLATLVRGWDDWIDFVS